MPRFAAWAAMFAAGLLALSPGVAAAGDALAAATDGRGTWSFNWENDIYGGTDRNYTNGVRLSYVSPPAGQGGLHGLVARNLFAADGDDTVRYGLAAGQSMYTPEDTEVRRPLPDQHPYAGWLYGEYSVYAQDKNSLRMAALQVGMVGPSAGGEWAQNNFHELINSYTVRGWDNQLEDELAFALILERKERALLKVEAQGLELDLTPSVGVTLGTLRTQATAGVTLRFGDSLQYDFGPPRIRPALGGSGFFETAPGFSWYLFAGVEGRAVARNIFLDGNTFKDSASVDKKPLVADLQAGLVLQYGRVQLAYTFVTRTREFDGQDDPQQFGAVSLSVRF